MANTLLIIDFKSAENTNYDPLRYHESITTAATPTRVLCQEVSAAILGTTIELGAFTTVTDVIVINEDSTNYVAVTWTNNATANSQRLLAGAPPLCFSGLTVANDLVLTANTAIVQCRVMITGT